MVHDEMLRALIELAKSKGWKEPSLDFAYFPISEWVDGYLEQWSTLGKAYGLSSLLFDHDFAKAVYGEVYLCLECGSADNIHYLSTGHKGSEPAWMHHLKEQAISIDSLKYMYDNRRKD